MVGVVNTAINIKDVSSLLLQHGDEFVEEKGDSKKSLTREDVELPDGWAWATQWGLDTNRACDEEGEALLTIYYQYTNNILTLHLTLY